MDNDIKANMIQEEAFGYTEYKHDNGINYTFYRHSKNNPGYYALKVILIRQDYQSVGIWVETDGLPNNINLLEA